MSAQAQVQEAPLPVQDVTLPISVVELLCSRLCHDVISPVAAISNGVELLNELGADAMDDAVGLLGHSARQAAVRLQLFRLAYGAGGSESLVSGKMIYEAFRNFIESDRVTFEWDLLNDVPDEDLATGFFKVLINALIFARESLIRGGNIAIHKQGHSLIITATDEKLTLREGMQEAFNLELAPEDLNPKTVHPYVTGIFARHFGFPLTLEHEAGKLTLTLAYTPLPAPEIEPESAYDYE